MASINEECLADLDLILKFERQLMMVQLNAQIFPWVKY
jgi:hypothetical protein